MYLTQDKLQMSSVNLLMIDKWIRDGKITLEEVGDIMPCIFHLDNADLSIRYLNNFARDKLELTLDEAKYLGNGFFDKFYHDSSQFLKEELNAFYSRKDFIRSYHNIIKLWYPKEQSYKASIISAKRARYEEGIYIISQPLDQVHYSPRKIQRIMEEERFIQDKYVTFCSLTDREKEIIGLLALGHNNPSIADYLFISRKTVEQHRKNINKKLNINSFVSLLKYAQAFDLV